MSNVLIIGDTHCPGMRKGYVDFLYDIACQWDIDTFVHIGDLVDWNSISYHEKNPKLPSPQQERDEAMRQVQELCTTFPNVEWLIGNHDELPARKCVTAMIPPDMLKDYHEQWELPDTWNVHDRFSHIEIDGVICSHGDSGAGGKYAHMNQAEQNFQSTVIGHFHSNSGVGYLANAHHRVFGMAVGTGIDSKLEQFKYGKRYPRKPINSCGVVLDGEQAFVEPMLL